MSKLTPAEEMVERVKRSLAGAQGKEALSALKTGSGSSVSGSSVPAHSSVSPVPSTPATAQQRCLLLDVSGSMAEDCEPGRSKWMALRALLSQFITVKMFAFSDRTRGCLPSTLPPPEGGTDMAAAFASIKAAGMRHAVLITDGLPNDEAAALRAAAGLKLDIFYVGPAPRPAFLDRLARATAGSAQTASLKQDAQKRLVSAVRLALPPGK